MKDTRQWVFMIGWMLGTQLVAEAWRSDALTPELIERNTALEARITERGRGIALKVGEALPEFGLINQAGKIVHTSDLRGQAFVLNFIFTRCKAAEMCPASTSRMATLQREAPLKGAEHLRFVSISFDPAYDTPAVLSAYAQLFGITPDNFDFLTYPRPEFIDRLLFLFGILTREEDGTITHNTVTYLINAEGRVVHKQHGPGWRSDEFLLALDKEE